MGKLVLRAIVDDPVRGCIVLFQDGKPLGQLTIHSDTPGRVRVAFDADASLNIVRASVLERMRAEAAGQVVPDEPEPEMSGVYAAPVAASISAPLVGMIEMPDAYVFYVQAPPAYPAYPAPSYAAPSASSPMPRPAYPPAPYPASYPAPYEAHPGASYPAFPSPETSGLYRNRR